MHDHMDSSSGAGEAPSRGGHEEALELPWSHCHSTLSFILMQLLCSY
jgi:hypothetical protein